MEYEVLEGALATLKYVRPSSDMVERFSRPTLYRAAGMFSAPDLDKLKELFDDRDLWVWSIIPEGGSKSVGYAMLIGYDGPPAVCVYLFDDKVDLEVSRDCILMLVHFFFRNSEEHALYFYTLKPVPAEVHEALIEGGFDPFEDNPTIEPNEMCYMLERHTYDAYYGEDADEDSHAFREGY